MVGSSTAAWTATRISRSGIVDGGALSYRKGVMEDVNLGGLRLERVVSSIKTACTNHGCDSRRVVGY